MSDSQKRNVSLHIKPDIAAGNYANLATVTIGKNEVILDFAFFMPNSERAEVTNRVVLSPSVAKNFLSAFQNAMIDFEKKSSE